MYCSIYLMYVTDSLIILISVANPMYWEQYLEWIAIHSKVKIIFTYNINLHIKWNLINICWVVSILVDNSMMIMCIFIPTWIFTMLQVATALLIVVGDADTQQLELLKSTLSSLKKSTLFYWTYTYKGGKIYCCWDILLMFKLIGNFYLYYNRSHLGFC